MDEQRKPSRLCWKRQRQALVSNISLVLIMPLSISVLYVGFSPLDYKPVSFYPVTTIQHSKKYILNTCWMRFVGCQGRCWLYCRDKNGLWAREFARLSSGNKPVRREPKLTRISTPGSHGKSPLQAAQVLELCLRKRLL